MKNKVISAKPGGQIKWERKTTKEKTDQKIRRLRKMLNLNPKFEEAFFQMRMVRH